MSLREVSDVMHTGNEILAPGVIYDPAFHVLKSLPGPQSLRRDLFSTCEGVRSWFGKSTTTLIWREHKVTRRQLTMLSETNSIPPPASSPAVFLHHGHHNCQYHNFGGGIGIVALVYSRKDAKEDKGKEKHEGIDVLRRVDEDMLLRISQLERTRIEEVHFAVSRDSHCLLIIFLAESPNIDIDSCCLWINNSKN